MASFTAPGRLGDPSMTLAKEPRLDPRLLGIYEELGILKQSFLAPTITPKSPIEAIFEFVLTMEASVEGFLNKFDYAIADAMLQDPITTSEKYIPGPDGNLIRLIIRRPTEQKQDQVPAVLYFHGGGMVILSTENAQHASWADALAKTGLVVISVDFRNALTSTHQSPFPAGLDDCVAATRWVDAHREQLGITKIVLQGDSGGANLAMATALRAKQEGWVTAISGVHASAPYISGAYGLSPDWQLEHLPSLVECDGYAISVAMAALNAKVYDPSGENQKNPLAWPYWATEEDLKGLPPHFIVTNELDAYRDEGNAYCRKLARAGVNVSGISNLGITHEAELAFRKTLPDIFLTNLWQCNKFIERV